MFQEGADTPGFGESDWWHAHVSGARLVYDHEDDRLSAASVSGESIDDGGRYRLAISEFLLHTEVEFPSLSDAPILQRLDTQYEILIEYARVVGIEPELEGRIARDGI